MIVVLPFYAGDEGLAYKNLQWIAELDPRIDADCVLSFDTTTNPERMAELAAKVFRAVYRFQYNPPPTRKWPQASNWAFHETAWHMTTYKQPWLWLESDCVPVRAGWYPALRARHESGGKPFTGHWNYKTGVWNGVSVYPHNTPEYGTNLMLVNNNPWDVWASKDIHPHLQIANDIFQHIWQDDQTGQAYSFGNMEEVQAVVRPGIYLFHRCKDFSLGEVLRNGTQAKKAEFLGPTFVHGGDVGDLIYALPTIKALGGGKLFMVPDNCREPFTEQKAARLTPLLNIQPYIKDSAFTEQPPEKASSFLPFRKRYKNGKTLALIQSELFGKNGTTTTDPWLSVDHPVRTDYPVIFHRSSRYHNPAFPWKTIVEKYRGKSLFVGLPREWKTFTKSFGHVDYHPTADFLELARIIAGCKLFVGNQSAPYSIAEGLKQNAILESYSKALDCQFKRPNVQNDPSGKVVLPDL